MEQTQGRSYFLYVAVAFVVVLMISNTIGSKIIELGPLTVAGAIFIFPISYIFGDILTEVYGYRASRRIIWCGFAALLFMSLCYWLVGLMPGAPFWQNQAAYDAILGLVPRIVLGSMLGYFAGEFCNSFVLSKMKIWSNGRHLWMRTIGSTLVGEAVDTVIFVSIAFGGIFAGPDLVSVIVSGYVVKVAIEVVLTPVTYAIVGALKRAEGIDTYDRDISYNPFTLRA
jgi:queuosine precursor transporter